MADPSQFDHMANRAFVSQLNLVRESVLNVFFEVSCNVPLWHYWVRRVPHVWEFGER